MLTTLSLLFNLATAAAFAASPALLWRYLSFTPLVRAFGVVLVVSCVVTFVGLAFGWRVEPTPSAVWTAQRGLQATAVWAFLISFHSLLKAASARRERGLRSGGDKPRGSK